MQWLYAGRLRVRRGRAGVHEATSDMFRALADRSSKHDAGNPILCHLVKTKFRFHICSRSSTRASIHVASRSGGRVPSPKCPRGCDVKRRGGDARASGTHHLTCAAPGTFTQLASEQRWLLSTSTTRHAPRRPLALMLRGHVRLRRRRRCVRRPRALACGAMHSMLTRARACRS